MRKWQDLAPPDDPESWYDVDGFWPTNRGSYETADSLSTTNYTATSSGTPVSAFSSFLISDGGLQFNYVVDDAGFIWRQPSSGTTMLNRTGSTGRGNTNSWAQFGDITILAQGSTIDTPGSPVAGASTLFANSETTTGFATLVGAPQASFAAVESNAVLLFRTSNAYDGWSASDVGDYTNWTTGEAASGRIFDPPGRITGAVSFRGSVYVFKPLGISRMRYVGGQVKWAVEKIWAGMGGSLPCAGANGILYQGAFQNAEAGTPYQGLYWYDGVNPPVLTNPMSSIAPSVAISAIVYCPRRDMFTVWAANAAYYFSPSVMAWGKYAAPLGGSPGTTAPITGNVDYSPTTGCWGTVSAGTLKLFFNPTTSVGATYLQTMKVGDADGKLTFGRIIPYLRRRADLGTDSAVLSMELFREREDTTAQTTVGSIAESTFRKRFDILASAATDNFARFKVTYTALDVEADDIKILPREAGKN